ncbi:MAG: tetratricopeptide repeat protein [Thermoanaerobaculia bacterium]
MRQRAVLALTLSLAIPGLAAASGSSGMTSSQPQMRAVTPEEEAIEYYNDGISYRDKAAAYEKEAAAETDAKKKAKLEAKAKDKHESSIKKFLTATKRDPRMFQAWGSLGYAYRVTGNYTASLEAYAKALEIQPAYTPAIEYRAEAYLGLGRLDEVKSAYMTLFNTDRKRADELTSAIDRWLERKKTDPAGIDPVKLDEFGKWASERKQLAAQTSSLTSGQELRW